MKGAAATRGGLSKLGAQAALYDLYGHRLSGHDLLKSVDQLAGALVEEGLLGRTIGLWYRNSFEAVQAFLAVEWIGGTRVTVDPRAPVGEVTAVLTAAGVDAVLTDRDYSFDGAGIQAYRLIDGPRQSPVSRPGSGSGQDVCCLPAGRRGRKAVRDLDFVRQLGRDHADEY